jgi:hypothetical protein
MTTAESARRVRAAGLATMGFGGIVGQLVWLLAFGEKTHGGLCFLPLGIGGLILGVGLILGRRAKAA